MSKVSVEGTREKKPLGDLGWMLIVGAVAFLLVFAGAVMNAVLPEFGVAPVRLERVGGVEPKDARIAELERELAVLREERDDLARKLRESNK
ncbi:MAG: hypothetical protein V1889_00935 [archaeon]